MGKFTVLQYIATTFADQSDLDKVSKSFNAFVANEQQTDQLLDPHSDTIFNRFVFVSNC